MTRDDYIKIIKSIEQQATRYYEEQPELESLEMQSIQNEIDSLNLDSIQLNLYPKKDGQKTRVYVILDSEGEFPQLYEFPEEVFHEVTETLYQVYTDYNVYSDFYDCVGIELETLVALVMNCKELPIISVRENVGMNDVRYWNSTPYTDGLLSMVTAEKVQEQGRAR